MFKIKCQCESLYLRFAKRNKTKQDHSMYNYVLLSVQHKDKCGTAPGLKK